MKKSWSLILSLASLCATAGFAQGPLDTLVVTMSNTDTNQLMVYDANGQLIQTVSTQGKGGASGNAGGIATAGNMLAAVNFGSQSVAVLRRHGNGFSVSQTVNTAS